jgi:hypothetical protein
VLPVLALFHTPLLHAGARGKIAWPLHSAIPEPSFGRSP